MPLRRGPSRPSRVLRGGGSCAARCISAESPCSASEIFLCKFVEGQASESLFSWLDIPAGLSKRAERNANTNSSVEDGFRELDTPLSVTQRGAQAVHYLGYPCGNTVLRPPSSGPIRMRVIFGTCPPELPGRSVIACACVAGGKRKPKLPDSCTAANLTPGSLADERRHSYQAALKYANRRP